MGIEPGRIFGPGLLGTADRRVSALLQAVPVRVPRDDHAERFALLHFVRSLLRLAGDSAEEALSAAAGCLRLYTSHFPCIVCVSVLSQFVRLLPSVQVGLVFEATWNSRSLMAFEQ